MKEYIIKKKTDWENVPELEICEPAGVQDGETLAFAKICYDTEALNVRLRAKEKYVRAENVEYDSMPCEDSCLEFFFSPDNASDKYFNIEYNPNKVRFLGYGSSTADLMRLFPLHDENFDFMPAVEFLSDGWQITYRVPYSFIRLFFPAFEPRSGGFIMANCYTTGEMCREQHDLTWCPVDNSVPNNYHNPKCFGKMIFE